MLQIRQTRYARASWCGWCDIKFGKLYRMELENNFELVVKLSTSVLPRDAEPSVERVR